MFRQKADVFLIFFFDIFIITILSIIKMVDNFPCHAEALLAQRSSSEVGAKADFN